MRIQELDREGLCGFVFKSHSPSCGLRPVNVYTRAGEPYGISPGIFAGEIITAFPSLPVEDEGRLRDASIRKNFIERVRIVQQHDVRKYRNPYPLLRHWLLATSAEPGLRNHS